MSQAFYRKWRPRTFAEVVGQDHVTQTLRNALKHSRIVHAYLFSGPRGTGKTTTARILAKAVNCLGEGIDRPCNECLMCEAIHEGKAIDLIEIDAASHTGVDDIRDLREKINFLPSMARYKFYIIDEVHMLSGSAFNALLKTLEEPPSHAIMVLATTEPHKIPATVLSRCQRFDFRPIPLEDMMARLRNIAAHEGLEVEEGALDLVARQSTGSMRDAESLLDQLSSYGGGEITLAQVQTMLGTVSSQAVKDLVDHLASCDVAAGLGQLGKAIADGADPRQLSKELLEYLRGLLLIKTTTHGPSYLTEEQRTEMARQAKSFTLDRLVSTIKLFNQATTDVRDASRPQLPLELAFVEATFPPELDMESPATSHSAPGKKPLGRTKEEKTISGQVERRPSRVSQQADAKPAPASVKEHPGAVASEGKAMPLKRLEDHWTEILAAINTSRPHVAAVIRGCAPAAVEGDVATLRASSPFHKEQLEEDRSRKLVEDAISKIMGQTYRVKCILAPSAGRQDPQRADEMRSIAEDPLVKAGLELGGEIGGIQ